jgi:succinyl-CoA synthetase beta subunit
MNLHEYQAKELLAKYDLPVPTGQVVSTAKEALDAFEMLGGQRCVVKAQVHAGGRGKAGGVKLCSSKDEVARAVETLIGRKLVTYQTDANGQPINSVLIEETSNIVRELYLGAVVDRATRRIVFMASTEGGVDIETIAHETPEKILKITVDPIMGALPYQARELGFALRLPEKAMKAFTKLLVGLSKMFVECDLSLLEINPLVITAEDDLVCLDGKINIDDNALFRQPELKDMRDSSQEDDRINRAQAWELNYVPLEGDIGCMVNGAGLAMATMDVIQLHGGKPANFLDVGGGATKERVTEAFKIILEDSNVQGILVNIFGGIVRCDLIADGIIEAVKEVEVKVPVVVRLEGNNADLGAEKLKSSGLNIIPANSLSDGAQKIIEAVKSN